jgi:hypothetical protein
LNQDPAAARNPSGVDYAIQRTEPLLRSIDDESHGIAVSDIRSLKKHFAASTFEIM